jgi:hypothetical protein
MNKRIVYDPNEQETEQDGIKAGSLRILKFQRQQEKFKVRTKEFLELRKNPHEKTYNNQKLLKENKSIFYNSNTIKLFKRLLGFTLFGFYKYERKVQINHRFHSINQFRLFIATKKYSDWESILISIDEENYKTPYKYMCDSWIDEETRIPKFEINLLSLNYKNDGIPTNIKLDVNKEGLIKKIKLEAETKDGFDLIVGSAIFFNCPLFFGWGFSSLIFIIWAVLICLARLYVLMKIQYELKMEVMSLEHLSYIYNLETINKQE